MSALVEIFTRITLRVQPHSFPQEKFSADCLFPSVSLEGLRRDHLSHVHRQVFVRLQRDAVAVR